MQILDKATPLVLLSLLIATTSPLLPAQAPSGAPPASQSRSSSEASPAPASASYQQVQRRLARGWNTWDVNSVTTHVLLPEGLAIHIGLKHNATEGGDTFLSDALIGRQSPGAEQVFPGPHNEWKTNDHVHENHNAPSSPVTT